MQWGKPGHYYEAVASPELFDKSVLRMVLYYMSTMTAVQSTASTENQQMTGGRAND